MSFVIIQEDKETVFFMTNSFIDHHLQISELSRAGTSSKGSSRGIGLYNVAQIISHYDNFFLDTHTQEIPLCRFFISMHEIWQQCQRLCNIAIVIIFPKSTRKNDGKPPEKYRQSAPIFLQIVIFPHYLPDNFRSSRCQFKNNNQTEHKTEYFPQPTINPRLANFRPTNHQ